MFTAKEMQIMDQLRRAMQLMAGALPEEQAREVAGIYAPWAPDVRYRADVYLTHGTDANGDPILYRTVQAHTSQEDRPPESTPALYTRVSLGASGHPIWAQPSGAHDAYDKGDVVERNSKLYKSKIDGNVWDPELFPDYWEIYVEV